MEVERARKRVKTRESEDVSCTSSSSVYGDGSSGDEQDIIVVESGDEDEIMDDGVVLTSRLKEHQKEGTRFIQTHDNVLLADPMGLGKTLQAIAGIRRDLDPSQGKHALIVCPKSVLGVWVAQSKEHFRGLKFVIYDGKTKMSASYLQQHVVHAVVTNYERLRINGDGQKGFLLKQRWTWCVLDECHVLRTIKTKKSEVIHMIDADKRLCLSGTPTNNKTSDLFHTLSFLRQEVGEASDWNSNSVQGQHDTFLRAKKLLANVMIRRPKTGMPRLDIFHLRSSFSSQERNLYDKAFKALSEDVKFYRLTPSHNKDQRQYLRGRILAGFNDLLKICSFAPMVNSGVRASTKISMLKKYVQKHLVDEPDCENSKLVVFGRFKDTLKAAKSYIERKFGIKCLYMDGDTKHQDRALLVKRFQQRLSPERIFFMTTKVGGMGITLTTANREVFLDTEFNPMEGFAQPVDRIHRIGQERDCVVTVFEITDTIEQNIRKRCDCKRFLAEALMSDDSDIEGLIESFSGLNRSVLGGGGSANNYKSLTTAEGISQLVEERKRSDPLDVVRDVDEEQERRDLENARLSMRSLISQSGWKGNPKKRKRQALEQEEGEGEGAEEKRTLPGITVGGISDCKSVQMFMSGMRFFVPGDTYTPEASKFIDSYHLNSLRRSVNSNATFSCVDAFNALCVILNNQASERSSAVHTKVERCAHALKSKIEFAESMATESKDVIKKRAGHLQGERQDNLEAAMSDFFKKDIENMRGQYEQLKKAYVEMDIEAYMCDAINLSVDVNVITSDTRLERSSFNDPCVDRWELNDGKMFCGYAVPHNAAMTICSIPIDARYAYAFASDNLCDRFVFERASGRDPEWLMPYLEALLNEDGAREDLSRVSERATIALIRASIQASLGRKSATRVLGNDPTGPDSDVIAACLVSEDWFKNMATGTSTAALSESEAKCDLYIFGAWYNRLYSTTVEEVLVELVTNSFLDLVPSTKQMTLRCNRLYHLYFSECASLQQTFGERLCVHKKPLYNPMNTSAV